MEFQIIGVSYAVVIAPGRIIDENGELAGICRPSRRRIEISGTLPVRDRLETLLHELRHAWTYHLGRPVDDESDAASAAAFTLTCMRQLAEQGGEAALMALRPEVDDADPEAVESPPPETFVSGDGLCECGCGRVFGPWEVITGTPAFGAAGTLLVPRAVYCEGCRMVLEWHERALDDGNPNGQLAGPMRRLEGQAVTDWLRRHGERVGVTIA